MIQLFQDTNHLISLEKAKRMVRTYREQKRSILQPDLEIDDVLPDSELFNREAVDRLLALAGCAGIRIYYGMDEQKRLHAILVGVDAANRDLLAAVAEPLDTADPVIVQEAIRCPPTCPPDSDLYP